MKLVKYCLYIYLLLRPYYLFKSGGLQISDLFLLIAFLFLILVKRNKKEELCKVLNDNKEFIIFTICTFIINVLYFIYYLKFKFILSSLYFLFNTFAIVLFSFAYKDKLFLNNISKIFKINMFIQLIIFLLGIGKYYGTERYMGTFNDPNQFGYYCLLSYMFIYLISLKNNKKNNYIYLLLCIFLIFQCASTGMLLAILSFIVLNSFEILKKILSFINKYFENIFLIIILVFLILTCINLYLSINNVKLTLDFNDITLVKRVKEKFIKVNSNNKNITLVQERGYDRFIYYPQYVLFGSGEGEYTRFIKTYHQDEIHATFPSILFYYGLLPFIFLIIWIFKKMNHLDYQISIPYIALFIESFTLLNQRQVLFWILILLSNLLSNKYKEEK